MQRLSELKFNQLEMGTILTFLSLILDLEQVVAVARSTINQFVLSAIIGINLKWLGYTMVSDDTLRSLGEKKKTFYIKGTLNQYLNTVIVSKYYLSILDM